MPTLLLKIARVTAFGLLFVSLLIPWYRVPVGVQENGGGSFSVAFRQPGSTPVFKGFVLGVLALAWWVGRRDRRTGAVGLPSSMTISGCALIVVLGILYPALTIQRCAGVSAHAGWLQAQNYSLTMPTGDAYRAQEYAHEPGQPLVSVAEVVPRAFEALPPPVDLSSFSDFRLDRLEEILMWLGLSPAFCQFIYRGWFCAMFGSFLLVAAFVRPRHRRKDSHGKITFQPRVPLILIGGTLIVSITCLSPVILASRELLKAQTLAAEDGKWADALHHLDLMTAWVPVLAFNTDVIYQRGWLERKLGLDTLDTRLVNAMREEEESFSARAIDHYSTLLKGNRESPVWAEAYRGVLRLAILDFNAGLIDRAGCRLRELQSIDPTCVKANYTLQLAYLRTLHKEDLEREVAQFETLYGAFQSLEKSGLIAAAHRRLAELEYDYRDLPRLGDEMRAAIKP